MRFALVNPRWSFDGSIYFGCREPHLPLEYGYSKALLESAGHDARIFDGDVSDLPAYRPDFTVVTTAPSYLFWRCAPPELRVPQLLIEQIRSHAGTLIAVGPHASTTPHATRRKLGADIVVVGECEELLPQIGAGIAPPASSHASDMTALPALHWPDETIAAHAHHHHRFDAPPEGPGAEMETSRGCPYHCTFCAKDNFRDSYRKRPLPVIFEELDGLLAQGVEYIYFIDEIFLPNADMLEGFAARKLKFGIQTRIDLWNERMIDLLGRAGCVSIEAGVESISEEGRAQLDKKCRMSTQQLADRLIYAKARVPFVQANLLEMQQDDPAQLQEFRAYLLANGVWANEPVPLFPYPGSPEYTRRWGAVDDQAWERAHQAYLDGFDKFSDIQETRPAPLVQLELAPHAN